MLRQGQGVSQQASVSEISLFNQHGKPKTKNENQKPKWRTKNQNEEPNIHWFHWTEYQHTLYYADVLQAA